jgi:hypothetical protein
MNLLSNGRARMDKKGDDRGDECRRGRSLLTTLAQAHQQRSKAKQRG